MLSNYFLFVSILVPDFTSVSWFSNEAVKSRVERRSLLPSQTMPVNSIDVVGATVVVAGDNEAIYCVNNVL